jgi:hypothetical protein
LAQLVLDDPELSSSPDVDEVLQCISILVWGARLLCQLRRRPDLPDLQVRLAKELIIWDQKAQRKRGGKALSCEAGILEAMGLSECGFDEAMNPYTYEMFEGSLVSVCGDI